MSPPPRNPRSAALLRAAARVQRAGPHQALPGSTRLAAWLTASGSLTQRLRATGTHLDVVRLAQGSARLLPGEARAMGWSDPLPRGHVREVLLRVDGVPLVYARSVAAGRAVNGPWRALTGLGTRPLAELLFATAAVRRSPLHALRMRRASPWQRHVRTQCARLAPELALARTLWARWSLFVKDGQPLRVLEVFAPSIRSRAPGPRRLR